MASPFSAPSAGTAGPSPFGQPSASTTTAFGAPSAPRSSKNPFANPFSQPASATGGSNALTAPPQNPFGRPSASSKQKPKGFGFGSPAPTEQKPPRSSGFGAPSQPKAGNGQPSFGPPSQPSGFRRPVAAANGTNSITSPGVFGAPTGPAQTNGRPKRHQSPLAPQKKTNARGPQQRCSKPQQQKYTKHSDYAKAIYSQLKKDGVQRPRWPKNAGLPSQRNALDDMMQAYKKYRDDARRSLIKANLIDDPEKPKRLADAIDFKGICEEMCPEWEKIKRIIQHDVKYAEKSDGNPNPDLMIKALARSAAGQEAPLPMDVLSVASCRRTVDYLLDEVLRSDNNLSTVHGFLWDRTRAIRRDFVFFSSTTDAEKLDQIYCLETIVRFHVVALHLMSQKGFAGDDYSEKQEIEQLSKSLLSLQDMYKRCRKDKRIVPPNEAEFIAYSILLYARDPTALSRVYQWGNETYGTSNEVRTAISIVEAIQNTWDKQGPDVGRQSDSLSPFHGALPGYALMFSILEDPEVSYTMACFGEILFGWVRQSMLKTIHSSFWRPRTVVKDFTVKKLRKMLKFDTDEELVEFVESHGVEFDTNDKGEQFMILVHKGNINMPKIYQSFSQNLVETKRGQAPITQAIREQVYQDEPSTPPIDDTDLLDEPLFVSDEPDSTPAATSKPVPRAVIQPPLVPAAQPTPSPFSTPQQTQAPSASASNMFTPKPVFPATDIPSATPAGDPPQPQSSKDPFKLLNNPPPFLSHTPQGEPQSGFQPPKGPIKLETTTAVPSPPVPTTDSVFSSVPTLKFDSIFSSIPVESSAPVSSFLFDSGRSKETTQPSKPGIQVTPPTPAKQDGSLPASFLSFTTPSNPPAEPPAAQSFSQQPSNSIFAASVQADTSWPDQGKSQRPLPPAQAPTQILTPNPMPVETTPVNKPFDTFTPLTQNVAPVDKMKGFTRWIVTGDDGLMDQFLEVKVEQLVQEAWDQYHAEINDAKRREVEMKDATTATEFRRSKLVSRYVKLWRAASSRQASRRKGRENRARVHAWRTEKIARDKQSRLAAERKAREPKPDKLDEFKKVVSAQRNTSTLETALLGTGLLAGVHDAQLSAHRVAADAHWEHASSSPGTTAGRNKRHKFNGALNGFSKSLSRLQQHGSSSVADDTASVASGISSILSQPERSRGKTARVLEALRQADGLGGNFRRSLPPMSFARSVSGSTMSQEQPKRQTAIPDPYWTSRIYGHVLMPNGQMLPEKIAESIGKEIQYPKPYILAGSMSPPSTKRQRSVSETADLPDTTVIKVKKHRVTASVDDNDEKAARLQRVKENDPETYALIMSTRQASALLDDATDFLRESNRKGSESVVEWGGA